LDGLLILRDISIEDICKAIFKQGSLEMTKPFSDQKNINTNGIKTNKDIEIPIDSNIDLKKYDDNLLHNKETRIFFAISSDSKNNSNEYHNIDYWNKDLQLTKADENIPLDPNEWLSDQHLKTTMQILYVEKLQSLGYEQHTYAIIGKKCTCVKKCLQHIFINNNH
jgi:hypothetical protein